MYQPNIQISSEEISEFQKLGKAFPKPSHKKLQRAIESTLSYYQKYYLLGGGLIVAGVITIALLNYSSTKSFNHWALFSKIAGFITLLSLIFLSGYGVYQYLTTRKDFEEAQRNAALTEDEQERLQYMLNKCPTIMNENDFKAFLEKKNLTLSTINSTDSLLDNKESSIFFQATHGQICDFITDTLTKYESTLIEIPAPSPFLGLHTSQDKELGVIAINSDQPSLT